MNSYAIGNMLTTRCTLRCRYCNGFDAGNGKRVMAGGQS
jgi:MoaA/NifB/PqqE/SkfB family radical SAM enzyme